MKSLLEKLKKIFSQSYKNPGCSKCKSLHQVTNYFGTPVGQCRHEKNIKRIFFATTGEQKLFYSVENFNSKGQCRLFEEDKDRVAGEEKRIERKRMADDTDGLSPLEADEKRRIQKALFDMENELYFDSARKGDSKC